MIVKLSEETISKISSGETISSLTGMVKELLENALDASSTEITVEINDYLSLSIEDNGSGIKEEDFELLCARYCTSKLKSSNDLYTIGTYGFRGEALSSISFCSNLTVKSGNFECIYEKGILIHKKRIPYKKGSHFFINNIFYNDISKKEYFYKRKEELRKIIDLLFYYKIISNTKIKLILDSKVVDKFCLNSFSANEKCVALEIYNKLEHPLLYKETNDFFLFFSPPSLHLRNSIIRIFLNKRLISDQRIKNEIVNIYKSILPINKFPFLFLSINLPQEQIDINIHPSKKEALFNEDYVIKEIRKIIIEGLNESITSIPSIIKEKKQISYSENKSQKIYESTNNLFDLSFGRKREFKLKSINKLKEEFVSDDEFNFNKLIYVGKEDGICYCQYESKLLKFEIKKLFFLFFKQIFTIEFGDFKKIEVNYELTSEVSKIKKEFLFLYFHIKIENNKIKESFSKFNMHLKNEALNEFINFIYKMEFNEEIKVFKEIIDYLSNAFNELIDLNEVLFNVMKERIISTKEIINCFYEIITLNELYKIFERT